MALKSTIFKIDLNVADIDRQVYGDFPLTLARHPSETIERMMLRVLAFALHANEQLTFGRGISTDDEPDLWQKDLTGSVELWIELGAPDPDRLRKACARGQHVVLYMYGDRSVPVWWQKHAGTLARFKHLSVWQVDDSSLGALAQMAKPGLNLQCTISDGEVMVSGAGETFSITPVSLKP
ncbi:MAG: YaeQ family protein [Haliea sp.]|jgi:uncharacterized protein YaeQ|nr:YaeQ family protein [Haliea sp.]MDP5063676.1 YaeQ family protein [Haliea sp.]